MACVGTILDSRRQSALSDSGQVIESIYDAASQRELWPDALQSLALFSGCVSATHFLWRKNDQSLGYFIGSRDYSGDDLYRAHYARLDPRREVAQRTQVGTIMRCHEQLSPDFVRLDPFYQEFSIPHGRRFLMSTHLIKTEAVSSFVALHRNCDQGAFTDKDASLLQLLAPHLRRAAQIQLRLEEVEAARKIANAALDRLTFGMVTVDRNARVLSMNKPAEDLLSADDGLSLRRGCLVAVGPEKAALASGIREATEPTRNLGRQGASVLVLRPSGRDAYRVLIAPLADDASGSFGPSSRRVALVLISDPDHITLPPEQHLASFFGLTPTEANIALALLRGKRLEDISDERSVRLGTVRAQLKSVLRKTGVERQSDLIRLLLTIPTSRSGTAAKPERARAQPNIQRTVSCWR